MAKGSDEDRTRANCGARVSRAAVSRGIGAHSRSVTDVEGRVNSEAENEIESVFDESMIHESPPGLDRGGMIVAEAF